MEAEQPWEGTSRSCLGDASLVQLHISRVLEQEEGCTLCCAPPRPGKHLLYIMRSFPVRLGALAHLWMVCSLHQPISGVSVVNFVLCCNGSHLLSRDPTTLPAAPSGTGEVAGRGWGLCKGMACKVGCSLGWMEERGEGVGRRG